MCLIMRTCNFNQSYWLKLSIELNTQKRIEAEKKTMTKMEKRRKN